MKLYIGTEEIYYIETPTADDVIVLINENSPEGYFFSHFIVDGIDIYENHEDFLERNLRSSQ